MYSVSACKGRCCKSTTSVNLADTFSKNNKKVAIIDLTPQSNATTMMRIEHNEIKGTIATLISKQNKIRNHA